MKSLWLSASFAALVSTTTFTAAEWNTGSATVFEDLDDLDRLQAAFNRDKGNVRLVTLLSPSCGYCIKGYRYVQKILKEVDDPRLKVYVVWEPMLSGDSRDLAKRLSEKVDDPRIVHQSWDGEKISGKAWQEVLDLENVAWDVYFLYGPDAEWSDSRPAAPDYWEHQGQASRDNWLNYETLKAKVVEQLTRNGSAPGSGS